jgi:hypothetical protein
VQTAPPKQLPLVTAPLAIPGGGAFEGGGSGQGLPATPPSGRTRPRRDADLGCHLEHYAGHWRDT